MPRKTKIAILNAFTLLHTHTHAKTHAHRDTHTDARVQERPTYISRQRHEVDKPILTHTHTHTQINTEMLTQAHTDVHRVTKKARTTSHFLFRHFLCVHSRDQNTFCTAKTEKRKNKLSYFSLPQGSESGSSTAQARYISRTGKPSQYRIRVPHFLAYSSAKRRRVQYRHIQQRSDASRLLSLSTCLSFESPGSTLPHSLTLSLFEMLSDNDESVRLPGATPIPAS
jgi:hypothetical protein